MQTMREMLRSSLGRSLAGLRDEDRLAAAWPVACGRTLAARGVLDGFSAGLVHVHVADPAWLQQLTSMGPMLTRELARISGVRVTGIHFEVKPFQPPAAPPEGNRTP